MRLFYVPLELYRERYTEYLSGPNGMFERQAKELGVDVVPIRPNSRVNTIETGVVLDPIARCSWAFEQTQQLVQMITTGFITNKDVIYFEDFWHPGMEMVPYAMSLVDREQIKLYAFNHAQSVDPNDFTANMPWMRAFEIAWAKRLSGIFCAANELAQMMTTGWGSSSQYHSTGTVFDHRVLYDIVGLSEDWDCKDPERPNTVVFSSRWDKEKDPAFFCQLADAVLKERDDVAFVVCTGAKELRSNDPSLLELAKNMQQHHGEGSFKVLADLTKADYYNVLADSSVQFNCARQDFVSYTLLEAATFGCAPLYPNRDTFPDALHHHESHLYKPGNVFDAKLKLYALLGGPLKSYEWVYKKYERSVHRMLRVMGFDVPAVDPLSKEILAGKSDALKEMYS